MTTAEKSGAFEIAAGGRDYAASRWILLPASHTIL